METRSKLTSEKSKTGYTLSLSRQIQTLHKLVDRGSLSSHAGSSRSSSKAVKAVTLPLIFLRSYGKEWALINHLKSAFYYT
jgi:hypothetical protein